MTMMASTTSLCWVVLGVAAALLVSSGDGATHYARPGTKQVKPLTPAQHRQVQQWQVAFNLPPGTHVQQSQGPPPGPAAPGHIWIQVPAPQQNYSPQPPPNIKPPAPETPQPIPDVVAPPTSEVNDPDLQPPPTEAEEEYPEDTDEETIENEEEGGADEDTDPFNQETTPAPVPVVPSKPMTPVGPLAPGDEDGATAGLHPGNEDGASVQGEDGTGVEVAEDREVIPHVIGPVGEAWEIAQVSPGQEVGEGAEEGLGGDGGDGAEGGELAELLKSCKEPRGQFASEKSCNMYVNCWDDYAIEQQCQGALVFNDKEGYCDYPENVACGARPIKKPDVMGETSACPTPYGRYRSSTSCGVFYVCDGGRAIKFECPDGLNYNSDLGVCDYAARVECDGTSWERPATAAPPPEEPAPEALLDFYPPIPVPTITAPSRRKHNNGLRKVPASKVNSRVACRHNTVYRLNRACTSVSVCHRGYTSVVNCARGKAWDAKAKACISAKKARC